MFIKSDIWTHHYCSYSLFQWTLLSPAFIEFLFLSTDLFDYKLCRSIKYELLFSRFAEIVFFSKPHKETNLNLCDLNYKDCRCHLCTQLASLPPVESDVLFLRAIFVIIYSPGDGDAALGVTEIIQKKMILINVYKKKTCII